MTTPASIAVFVLGGSVVIIAAVLFGLNQALIRAAWPPAERVPALRAAAIILIGWFAAAVALAWFGVYEGGPGRLPTIQFGILIPIAVGAYLIWRSPMVSRIIDAVPQQWLVGVQIFRAGGAIFLVLYAAGRMPGLFALPAGVGDILVGTLAPIVAWAYARNPRGGAGLITGWNVFGIADLVVAVGTGLATAPSPLQVAAFEAPNTLIADFPLVLIPAYLVPFWTVLHIASLTKLRRTSSRPSPRHAAAASA
jgi:hypothetical protein